MSQNSDASWRPVALARRWLVSRRPLRRSPVLQRKIRSPPTPLLNAEVGISGATISEVAAVVTSAFQQWQIIGAAIEAVRLGTRAAIGAAETAEDAHGAFATMEWPASKQVASVNERPRRREQDWRSNPSDSIFS